MININQIKMIVSISNSYKLDDVKTLDFVIREEEAIHIQEIIRNHDARRGQNYFYLAIGRVQDYYKKGGKE